MNKLLLLLDEPLMIKDAIKKDYGNEPVLEKKDSSQAFHQLQLLINSSFADDLSRLGLDHRDIASYLSNKNSLKYFVKWIRDEMTWDEAWERFNECLEAKK